MVLKLAGESIKIEGIDYFVGMNIIGTKESEYEGLSGTITEVRTDPDKDTENDGPDIYCNFAQPEDAGKIRELEKVFSELYGEAKSIDDICLDCVIMAPNMIAPLDSADNLKSRIIEVIDNALALAGFKIMDGDKDVVIVRHAASDTDFEIRIEGISS